MFKIWRFTSKNTDLVIPKDQPVVLDGKLKIGNGVDPWSELRDVAGRSDSSGPEVPVTRKMLTVPFTYETPDILSNPGVFVTTLPNGTVIEDAWLESNIPWSTEAHWLSINVMDDDGTWASIVNYNNIHLTFNHTQTSAVPFWGQEIIGPRTIDDVQRVIPVRVGIARHVYVLAGADESPIEATAGSSVLYMLYSEPV